MSLAHRSDSVRSAERLKLAELTSSLGAGLLGGGIGVLLAGHLAGLGLPVLVLGLVMHAWGMRSKHELEAGAPRPSWSAPLYWACWLALGALALYSIARVVTAI